MNARSLVVTIAALALSAQCLAQEPDFGDLGVTETSTYTRNSTYRRIDVDAETLDASLLEARNLLDGVSSHFRSIFLSSERLFREAGGNVALAHWDKDRFVASKTEAAELRSKAGKLKGIVTKLNEYFASLNIDDRHNYAILAERHAKVVCLITEYNDLMAWASTFNLDFDTAAFFDERDMFVLERDSNPKLPLPVLPIRKADAAVSETKRELVEGRNGSPLVRTDDVIVTTKSSEYRAVDPEQITEIMASAQELADRAEVARSQILTLADDTYNRRLSFSKSLKSFETEVKPQVVDFALVMLRLKGLRNATWALLENSDLLVGDQNTQARWLELQTRFDDLARWGDSHFIRWSVAFKIDRPYVIFFRTNFATTGLFTSNGEVLRGQSTRSIEGTRPMGQRPTLSVNDAFRLVKAVSGSTRRKDMCLKVLPQVKGLSASDLSNLVSWIGNNAYEAEVMSFGLSYLNR